MEMLEVVTLHGDYKCQIAHFSVINSTGAPRYLVILSLCYMLKITEDKITY